MTWQPSKQQLEDAARAAGHASHYWPKQREGSPFFMMVRDGSEQKTWNPHLPTVYGKADLLDLMLALPVGIYWLEDVTMAVVEHRSPNGVVYTKRTNIQKLAQAVIEVAALVGAKMRGEV